MIIGPTPAANEMLDVTFHLYFHDRCAEHPDSEAIIAEFQDDKGKAAIEAMLKGEAAGDDCPSSALKPSTTHAHTLRKDSESAVVEAEAQDEGDVAETQDGDPESDLRSRTLPQRNRSQPKRLDTSPRLKSSKKSAAANPATESEPKPKGLGRGQKSGPRGQGGQKMTYKKRRVQTAGGDEQKVKVEGEELPPTCMRFFQKFRLFCTACMLARMHAMRYCM